MRSKTLVLAALGLAGVGLAGQAWGASLDLTSAYKLDAISYANLNLLSPNSNSLSYMANDARLGFTVNRIDLESLGGGDQTLDVHVLLHALGAPGLNAQPTPFAAVAAKYPSANFTPFIENAYIEIHNLFNTPMEATIGQQSFKLGSGLLLDDDGAGLTGVTLLVPAWWDLKTEFFVFKTNTWGASSAPAGGYFSPTGNNSLDLFGMTLAYPTDGLWQINELVEHDPGTEVVPGCKAGIGGPNADDPVACTISHALRSFTSLRYTVNVGPLFFDGEGAIERGKGYAAVDPLGNKLGNVDYDGNAEILRAKWKQPLYRVGEGIARITVAHGSGYRPSGSTTDTAFFPSQGHQFDGLDRQGFGAFFGATPYSAFGGSYTPQTPSGLPANASGINAVGAGYTPPAYHGIALDLDLYYFQADRVTAGTDGTLGDEWDIGLRYDLADIYDLSLTYASFKIGPAINPSGGMAHKVVFQASGRF